MSESRKLAAILVADVVGYSRLAGTDEDRTLARLRGLRSDLIDPAIAAHHGRIVKRTGDGSIIEFRSVVDAVHCAIEIQNGLIERNAGVREDKRIEFRVGIHVGDVVEEDDGDLMGDGVNVAARLEGICEPGAICLSEDAYRQVKSRLELRVTDLGPQRLKNIFEPVRAYLLRPGATPTVRTSKVATNTWRWVFPLVAVLAAAFVAAGAYALHARLGPRLLGAPVAADKLATAPRLSIVVLPFENLSGDKEQDYFANGITDDLTTDLSHLPDSFVIARNTAFTYKGKLIDVRQIGNELGVRYVLEGSVRRLERRSRSTLSSSRPRPARTSGPTASRAKEAGSANCSSNSWPASPIRSGSNSSRPKHCEGCAKGPTIRMPSTSPCVVEPSLNQIQARRLCTRPGCCSNVRALWTRMMCLQ